MTSTAFPAPSVPLIPVTGGPAFPLRRIFCVGRNYADHAAEMGDSVDRRAPFYFTKSCFAYLQSGADMPYPPRTADLHHEVELTMAIGAATSHINADDAESVIFGYGCGLDMTRRDLQLQAKDARRPWDVSKDFDSSAIIAPLTPAAQVSSLGDLPITLTVNGDMRQSAHLSDMVWSVPDIIADLSGLYALQPGDLIMMGTPAGVGPVVKGDVLRGQIGDFAPVETRIIS